MSEVIRIDPPIPLTTPKGKAMAHFLIDYGFEHHLMWVTFIEETGECWTFRNPEIRMQSNISARGLLDKARIPQQYHDYIDAINKNQNKP